MTISPDEAGKYLVSISNNSLNIVSLQAILYLADINYVGGTGKRLLSEDFQDDSMALLPTFRNKYKSFGSEPVAVGNIFEDAKNIDNTKEAEFIDVAYEVMKDLDMDLSGIDWDKLKIKSTFRNISMEEMLEDYKTLQTNDESIPNTM